MLRHNELAPYPYTATANKTVSENKPHPFVEEAQRAFRSGIEHVIRQTHRLGSYVNPEERQTYQLYTISAYEPEGEYNPMEAEDLQQAGLEVMTWYGLDEALFIRVSNTAVSEDTPRLRKETLIYPSRIYTELGFVRGRHHFRDHGQDKTSNVGWTAVDLRFFPEGVRASRLLLRKRGYTKSAVDMIRPL